MTLSWMQPRIYPFRTETTLRWHPGVKMMMSFYQYMDLHVKDKTVLRPSYLSHGNFIPGKMVFILRLSPGVPRAAFSPHCENIQYVPQNMHKVSSSHKGWVMWKAFACHDVLMIFSGTYCGPIVSKSRSGSIKGVWGCCRKCHVRTNIIYRHIKVRCY